MLCDVRLSVFCSPPQKKNRRERNLKSSVGYAARMKESAKGAADEAEALAD